MAEFMTILLMLLLCELQITVLNSNQFSPLVTLDNDFFLLLRFIFCIRIFNISGLPHVADPQPHDEMHVILFYRHLHLLVEQVLQVIIFSFGQYF